MTSATLGLGDFGDERLAKSGVCCAREGWRARPPQAPGGRPTQWDCRILALSGQSARDGCGAARWRGGGAYAALRGPAYSGDPGQQRPRFHDDQGTQSRSGRDRQGFGARGILLHAMPGVDAGTGGIPGLAAGRVWVPDMGAGYGQAEEPSYGRMTVPHRNRPLSGTASQRWLSPAEAAKTVLRQAIW